jgi:DNA primase catalytic subunit
LRPFTPHALRRFYTKGFEENDIHRRWAGLWLKQFKVRLYDGTFISLNKLRPRFSFQSLKRYSVRFAPVNLYMSALNWLMPERVAEKSKANHAYPIGGEYVVDVDHYLNYMPHSHRTTEEGVCEGCLENSREISLRLLDVMSSNYSKLEVVFSGRCGFHLHVLDFDPSDWTTFNEANPIKSHEVARLIYTKCLKQVCGGFDDDHGEKPFIIPFSVLDLEADVCDSVRLFPRLVTCIKAT